VIVGPKCGTAPWPTSGAFVYHGSAPACTSLPIGSAGGGQEYANLAPPSPRRATSTATATPDVIVGAPRYDQAYSQRTGLCVLMATRARARPCLLHLTEEGHAPLPTSAVRTTTASYWRIFHRSHLVRGESRHEIEAKPLRIVLMTGVPSSRGTWMNPVLVRAPSCGAPWSTPGMAYTGAAHRYNPAQRVPFMPGWVTIPWNG